MISSHYILVVILSGNHKAVSVLVVPLKHIASVPQQKGDTLGVSILCSNQKWRCLQMEVHPYGRWSTIELQSYWFKLHTYLVHSIWKVLFT